MRKISTSFLVRATVLGLTALALAGCGGSSKVAANKDEVVFTAANDCAATGKIKPAQCTEALEVAMKEHLKASPVYKNLTLCEAKEGKDHCERSDEKTYRPRLSAVALPVAAAIAAETSGKKLAGAVPLYPGAGKEMGFRTLDKRVLLYDGDMLSFSPQAIAAAELNASSGKKGGGGKLF